MKNVLLDTNVLIRFLIGDNSAQKKQAEAWFKEGEKGTKDILVSAVVVAETCFVLESFYKISRSDIARSLDVFLNQRWMKVPERDVLHALWAYYLKGLHFVDSYLCASSSIYGMDILTFDKELLKKKV